MQPTHQLRLVPRARRDLAEIHQYVEASSPQGADSLLRSLSASIDSLSFMPKRYKVFRSSRTAARVIRVLSSSSYLIYYRVRERPPTVTVWSIRHGAPLPPTRFPTK